VAGSAEGVSTVYIANGDWFVAVLSDYDEPVAEEIGSRIY
jgi:hypothetical protein